MFDILDRIEQRLKDKGISASAASLAAGLSKDAIRNIRRARSLGIDAGVNIRTVEALAPVLGTTKAWLLGEESESQASASHIPLIPMELLAEKKDAVLSGHFHGKAVINNIQISSQGENLAATRLADMSLSHIIPKDSIVVVDLKQTTLIKGGIYAISPPRQSASLRVYEDSPDRFVPSSALPIFDSFFEIDQIGVIGRAIAIYKEI